MQTNFFSLDVTCNHFLFENCTLVGNDVLYSKVCFTLWLSAEKTKDSNNLIGFKAKFCPLGLHTKDQQIMFSKMPIGQYFL
jgi:hypothetical protein